jgi:hypothetical protein
MTDLFVYKELVYSIKTLRDYNKDIPVKVFVSPKGKVELDSLSIDKTNLEFVEFDNDYGTGWYPSWLEKGYAEWLFHRWKNAFNSLEAYGFDNILYLDTDTIFHKDPELLFNKYGNSEYIYAKEDNSSAIMKEINMENGMNDGQFILNKSALPHKDKFLKFIKSYTNSTLGHYQCILNEQHFHELHWLMVQYAAYNYFNTLGILKYFDGAEVMVSNEPEFMNTERLILHHYYTGNIDKFLPSQYR